MTKRLLILLLLSSPVFAARIYQHDDPKMNDELDKIYHDQLYLRAVNVQASTGTFTYLNVSTITAISGTLTNGSITTLAGTQLTYTTGTINSFMVVGTATNDDAPLGRPGQFISSVVGNTFLPASGSFGDLTSISLTAGDWDVLGQVHVNNSTLYTSVSVGISTTTGNSSAGLTQGDNRFFGNVNNNSNTALTVKIRWSAASTFTVYLKMTGTYTNATVPQISGSLSARRMR